MVLQNPEVSIVTALYNRLDLTKEFLEGLERTLSGVRYEVVLVDDGSTDGTRDFLSKVKRPEVRVLFNDSNLGFAGSNNRGAQEAKGELLAFLNNDLVLRSRWLEPMIGALDPNSGFVGNVQLNAETGRIDHAGIVFTPWGIPEHWGQNYLSVPKKGTRGFRAVTAACCLIKRDSFLSEGGFDENFRNGFEDIDLCLRLQQKGRVNRISFESRVGHWVSASPGRKGGDAANIRLFLDRWGDQTASWGLGDWPSHYLLRNLRNPFRLNGRKTLDALSLMGRVRKTTPGWMVARASSLRKNGVPDG
ncbi:MAG: glycosyltransferase family 2 protein [Verrucomicrobiota bacterium]